jgi:hypothetical protein
MSTEKMDVMQSCTINDNLTVVGNTKTYKLHTTDLITENLRLQCTTKKGFVLTSGSNGVGQWKPLPTFSQWVKNKGNDNLYYKRGNIGIGVLNASEMLHVVDNARIDGFVRTSSIKLMDDNAYILKKKKFSIKTKKDVAFCITEANNVGINTQCPDERLVVEGNIKLTGIFVRQTDAFPLPPHADTLVGESQQQTLCRKTLMSPILMQPNLQNPMISGDVEVMNHSTIRGLRQPEESTEVATKEYVDLLSLSNSIVYLDNVKEKLSTPPLTDNVPIDTRYIIGPDANGSWKHKEMCIATWDGLEWVYEKPVQNNVVFIQSEEQQLIYMVTTNKWITFARIVSSHSNLLELTSDDHKQYLHINGRLGGQTVFGGTEKDNTLVLDSTSNIVKGSIVMNPGGGGVSVGHNQPTETLDVLGNIKVNGHFVDKNDKTYKLPDNDEEDVTTLVTTGSKDRLTHKTLVNPVIDGVLKGLRYSITHVKKSMTLSDEQVLLVMDSATLTLPVASEHSGRQYIIFVCKKEVRCDIKTSENDRINVNERRFLLTDIHEKRVLVSNGMHRWYQL